MNYSPLRYPGGKSKIAPLIRLIMEKAEESRNIYIEPFAGGAGVALSLLIDRKIFIVHRTKNILLNWAFRHFTSTEQTDLAFSAPDL